MTCVSSAGGAPELLLQIGDSALVLSHRLTEWCGIAPMLEDDVALSNIALDLLGQARYWLTAAGRRLDPPRDEDALAYGRSAEGYRNLGLVELPRGDFGFTILRQYLFDCWYGALLARLSLSGDGEIAGIAAKAARETRYHLDYSRDWLLRLGRATRESHARTAAALVRCWPHVDELFALDLGAARLGQTRLGDMGADSSAMLLDEWWQEVSATLDAAGLALPEAPRPGAPCGLRGVHGPDLHSLLAEMRSVTAQHPGASW